jgi:hypothetical protein
MPSATSRRQKSAWLIGSNPSVTAALAALAAASRQRRGRGQNRRGLPVRAGGGSSALHH